MTRMGPFEIATSEPILHPLAWDSEHFALRVAQITRPCLSPSQLRAVLRLARRQGTRLVYWSAHPQQPIPVELLDEHGGLLAARQVTFRSLLTQPSAFNDVKNPSPWLIRPYPRGRAAPALVALAVSAGGCSRFRTDRRISTARFASLYEKWIQRSTRHEIADVVLVASPVAYGDDLVGMVTLSLSQRTAHIGLLAVSSRVRRQGLGKALLQAAQQWILGHGAAEARVVAQLANQPACALYRRAGYRPCDVKHIYHFWNTQCP